MTYTIPTDLYLSVIRTSATMSLHMEGGTLRSEESFSLVLRASQGTNVVLSSGEKLADVDVHLTLSTKCRIAQELDRDLLIDDIGFLAHTEGELGKPFVHGCALLTDTAVVASLLSAGTKGRVSLVSPSVPFEDSKDTPYVWGKNRPNMLRISHLHVSVLCGESEAKNEG
jgi:hypothetical protein